MWQEVSNIDFAVYTAIASNRLLVAVMFFSRLGCLIAVLVMRIVRAGSLARLAFVGRLLCALPMCLPVLYLRYYWCFLVLFLLQFVVGAIHFLIVGVHLDL